MKTKLWTVDFSNGKRMFVSASTVLVAIKNAVWGYNKDSGNEKITPKQVIMICQGRIEGEIDG